MAKDDFTIKIENNVIMFMTSYHDDFGNERMIANIISKNKLIEIRDNINRALAELSNENCTPHVNNNETLEPSIDVSDICNCVEPDSEDFHGNKWCGKCGKIYVAKMKNEQLK